MGEKKAHTRSMLAKANQNSFTKTQLLSAVVFKCLSYLYHQKNTEDDCYWVKYELTMLGQDWFSTCHTRLMAQIQSPEPMLRWKARLSTEVAIWPVYVFYGLYSPTISTSLPKLVKDVKCVQPVLQSQLTKFMLPK